MLGSQSNKYSQERFKLVFDNSPIAIWEEDLSVLSELRSEFEKKGIHDIRRHLAANPELIKKAFRKVKVVDVNQAAVDLYGATSKAELISHFGRNFTPEVLRILIDEFSTFLEGNKYFEVEFRGKTSRGRTYDALLRVTVPEEYAKTFSRAIVMIQDISEQKKLERHLRRLAQLDSLTRLYNHNTIKERLDAEFQRAKRYGSSLSCMMIDVDHFKVINDEFGHQKGDHVIKEVANTIKDSLRQVDIVGRYGGDEFLIILPETRPQNAKVAANRIQILFDKKDFRIQAHKSVKIALSIGISGYPVRDVNNAQELMAKADKAMYVAKKQGRNRIVIA